MENGNYLGKPQKDEDHMIDVGEERGRVGDLIEYLRRGMDYQKRVEEAAHNSGRSIRQIRIADLTLAEIRSGLILPTNGNRPEVVQSPVIEANGTHSPHPFPAPWSHVQFNCIERYITSPCLEEPRIIGPTKAKILDHYICEPTNVFSDDEIHRWTGIHGIAERIYLLRSELTLILKSGGHPVPALFVRLKGRGWSLLPITKQ